MEWLDLALKYINVFLKSSEPYRSFIIEKFDLVVPIEVKQSDKKDNK